MKKIGLLLTGAIFLASCGSENIDNATDNVDVSENVEVDNTTNEEDTVEENNSEEKVIYTTIYPLQFIVEELIGDFATVNTVVPNNGDVHNFDIPQKTLIDVAESDMYIYLGLDIEFNADDIGNALSNENVKVLEVGEKLNIELDDDDHGYEEDEDHSHRDSHIWVNPNYVIDMAEIIKEELILEYPTLNNEINENFEVLKADLVKLDNDYKTQLENTDLNTFVVSHDKFHHLGVYGIETIAVKSEAHSKDPSAKEVESIIETINELGIEKVVFENNVPCIPLERIKSQTGTEKVIISSLGTRMTSEVEQGLDYIDIMYNNLDVLLDILNKE